MKNGANKRDQIQIAKMKKDGKSVGAISKALRVSEKVVKAFLEPEKTK